MGLMVQGMNAQTNVYHPMPDSNAIWSVTYGTGTYVDNDGPCCDCSQYQNLITGDTIIGSHTYHKLSKTGVEYYYYAASGCDFGQPTYSMNIAYSGAYRDDTSAKKVYVMIPDSTTEYLLFDFTMNVGDTVHQVFNMYTCPTVTVLSIDSILIGNSYRKRLNLNPAFCGQAASLIEGIGSTHGLFEQLTNFESGGQLTCFSQNDTSLFPSYLSGGCALITVGINGISKLKNQLTITPNPATTSIMLHSQLAINNSLFTIEDVLGNKIHQQTISGNDTQIDISTWSEGVYFYEVIGANETTRGKFVKE